MQIALTRGQRLAMLDMQAGILARVAELRSRGAGWERPLAHAIGEAQACAALLGDVSEAERRRLEAPSSGRMPVLDDEQCEAVVELRDEKERLMNEHYNAACDGPPAEADERRWAGDVCMGESAALLDLLAEARSVFFPLAPKALLDSWVAATERRVSRCLDGHRLPT